MGNKLENGAKERAGHCLRRFSGVLRGGYYGEVCILILASEATTSGCGGGGWFMRHLVIIQWGGGGGRGQRQQKQACAAASTFPGVCVGANWAKSICTGSFPLDVEVSYVFHGKWHGCQVLERSNPLPWWWGGREEDHAVVCSAMWPIVTVERCHADRCTGPKWHYEGYLTVKDSRPGATPASLLTAGSFHHFPN